MIAVLIPAYNASASLGILVNRICRYVSSDSVFVVDDGSTDGTASVAAAGGVTVLQHPSNRGKGAALRTGFGHILEKTAYEWIITLDADLQHNPDHIPQFMTRLRLGDCDLLLGRRSRMGNAMPLHRKISNAITSYLVSIRAGVRISDSQCGYRAISRKVLLGLDVLSDGYEAETEILLRVARGGFRIGMVPIDTIYGNERSYMTPWNTTKQFLKVLLREY